MNSPLIEVTDLTFRYPDTPPALSGISLRIHSGEAVALIGGNGAGKSTLLRHLNGLFIAESGSVRIGDTYVTHETAAQVRCRIGMVFQDADDQLFMPTVRDDVGFGPLNMGLSSDEIDRRVHQALEAVHASRLIDKFTHQLSGGEKRAVTLAGVLAMEPDILVLDEPTANLDPAGRRSLITLLRTLPQTKIIATHDLDMVMDLCPRCLVMKDGQLLADAPSNEVFGNKALLTEASLEQPLSYLLATRE